MNFDENLYFLIKIHTFWSKSILFDLQIYMVVRTHTEELRVPKSNLKCIYTFSYTCTLRPRSSSGWILTIIWALFLKSTIFQLSNAVSTIRPWFSDTKMFCYEFWTSFMKFPWIFIQKLSSKNLTKFLNFMIFFSIK